MGRSSNWCESDEHAIFENFADFNDWLDSREDETVPAVLLDRGLEKITQPSKAFYAGDREAYLETLREFQKRRRNDVLSLNHFTDFFSDSHWYERNEEHFNQLIEGLTTKSVIPFVGAGASVAGGFPTWKEHLLQQARTAGLTSKVEELLSNGQYEEVIESIEEKRGKEVFVQELRDVFSKIGSVEGLTFGISQLFDDTIVTTNYDHLIEQAYDTGEGLQLQILEGREVIRRVDPRATTIIKIHGDIKNPERCIISKSQYDIAYGDGELDPRKPTPKILRYYYMNSSLPGNMFQLVFANINYLL